MAQNSRDEKIAKSFKIRLDQLDCPFTKNVEESWVTELLFRPGEPRIRLLQWLFSRLDAGLTELLDPQFAPGNVKMDSRIQRLLFVASNLGLCSSEDVDLIRGVTSVSKQTSFMTQLLDLLCVPEEAEDQLGCTAFSLEGNSEGHDIEEMFQKDCEFMDKLASQTPTEQLCATGFKVLPPDIKKQIDGNSSIAGEKVADKVPAMQDVTDLLANTESITKELTKQNQILQELKDRVKYQPSDHQTTDHLNKSLKLVLCELAQLVMGFSACFETDMRQWCNKESPRLTELGPAFKRVHGLMDKFSSLLSGLGSIRQSHVQLCQTMKTQLNHVISPHSHSKFHADDAMKIQDCVHILQESVSRLEQSAESSRDRPQHPNLTVATINHDS